MELTSPEFWYRWMGIVLVDLALAGDNALVIAMAVRTLPPREQFWGRVGGALGAVVLRVCFVAVVSWLLDVPFLRCAGGLLLIWIAFKLVRPACEEAADVRHGTSLRQAIGIIVVADVVMSLDNVIAISGTADGDLLLVVFGLLLSLPLVVFGSGLLAHLMNRHRWIIWLGGGVLGYVAMDMIFDDPLIQKWLGALGHTLHRPVAVGLALVLAALGWWLARRAPRLAVAVDPPPPRA